MYLEAKETARLYTLLSDKLGNDTAEAMFKYIDNKTERSVEATIKTLATKDDLLLVKEGITRFKFDLSKEITDAREDVARVNSDLSTKIAESKADNIKWMFIFWIGQVGTSIAFIMLYLKK
jgi:hypothetical protein